MIIDCIKRFFVTEKKVKSPKGNILVDTQGRLLEVVISEANIGDH